jgi:hypothetical protein
LRPQGPAVIGRKSKDEIARETFLISLYLLVQAFRCRAVEPGQIRVQNHFLTTDFMDERFNLLGGERFR